MDRNYVPQPIDTSDVELSPIEQALLNRLAANCHDHWAKKRFQEGFVYGHERVGSFNPCLLPFDELSPTDQEVDFTMAGETLKAIKKLGYLNADRISEQDFYDIFIQNESLLPESLYDVERLRRLDKPREVDRYWLQHLISLNDDAKKHLKEIIGSGRNMRILYYKIFKYANRKTPVFLAGETGTGKQAFAKAIHYLSLAGKYSDRFIEINCASEQDPNFLISKIFGHTKGAFTGATSERIGAVKMADRGTLYLDEIGHAPPTLQDLLMKFLDEGFFSRMGSNTVEQAHPRIITATNQNIRELVNRGKFRSDLMYRLNMNVPITIPALRDRQNDIPLLAEAIVKRICDENRMNSEHIIAQFKKNAFFVRLKDFPWEGNVRELNSLLADILYYNDKENIDVSTIENFIEYISINIHGNTNPLPPNTTLPINLKTLLEFLNTLEIYENDISIKGGMLKLEEAYENLVKKMYEAALVKQNNCASAIRYLLGLDKTTRKDFPGDCQRLVKNINCNHLKLFGNLKNKQKHGKHLIEMT